MSDVAALREQLALTSSDAVAARVPAADSDHDVSRFALRCAPTQLRETQLEQSREMREGLASLVTGMAQITTLLTNR